MDLLRGHPGVDLQSVSVFLSEISAEKRHPRNVPDRWRLTVLCCLSPCSIVIKFLMKYIDRNIGFHRLIETKDMHERKLTMYSLSDIFLVLPGGIGTLDEMTEVLTWNQLGVHSKKVIIGNFEEFWTPYIDLLIHLNKFKYLSDLSRINYSIASNASDILKLIEAPDH